MKAKKLYAASAVLFFLCGFFPAIVQAAPFKVLAVMSYHEDMPWDQQIKEGMESVLSGTCDIEYAYLDTRKNYDGGTEKAKEIYARYQELNPDGVIVADDNAQEMFVLPYLKDKVKTPVIFCGVNAKPETYGYPASNVSGILERIHFIETIAFLQQIVPSVRTVGYLMNDNKTAQGYADQAKAEENTFPVKTAGYKFPKTLDEAVKDIETLKPRCDALFIDNLEGMKDNNGIAVNEKEIFPALLKAFGKPTFAANTLAVKRGVLCAVVKTGQEQGAKASEMLLKAMQGTPVSQIPIIRNQNGLPMINVVTMKALDIKPSRMILQGAELVKTE
jgi:ABC-type uncharacterized transport system substrate-binding protein